MLRGGREGGRERKRETERGWFPRMRQETGRVASYPLGHWEHIMDPFKVLLSETQRRPPNPTPLIFPTLPGAACHLLLAFWSFCDFPSY